MRNVFRFVNRLFSAYEVCSIADNIPHMSTPLHNRIRERLQILNLTPHKASLDAGLSRDYLRKFLDNPSASMRSSSITALAPILQVSPSWLMTGMGDTSDGPEAKSILPPRATMPIDVPVMGTAAANHNQGAFQFEGGVIDYVRRPPALNGAKDIYALYVEGTSMEPRHRHGDLLFVHPHKPARIGDDVIIQIKTEPDAPIAATLGELLRRKAEHLVIKKLNPPAEIELSLTGVVSIHKVLQINELFGI